MWPVAFEYMKEKEKEEKEKEEKNTTILTIYHAALLVTM